ncbi:hypothetical protein D3C75_653900 [compost metagenome]
MKLNEAPDSKGWLLAIVISLIAIIGTTVAWGGFKPVQEYHGWVESIFQNIYYLFEAALILLTIAFGQKFGETLIKRGALPYGDISCAHMGTHTHFAPRKSNRCVCVLHVHSIRHCIHFVKKEYPIFLYDDRYYIYFISISAKGLP